MFLVKSMKLKVISHSFGQDIFVFTMYFFTLINPNFVTNSNGITTKFNLSAMPKPHKQTKPALLSQDSNGVPNQGRIWASGCSGCSSGRGPIAVEICFIEHIKSWGSPIAHPEMRTTQQSPTLDLVAGCSHSIRLS